MPPRVQAPFRGQTDMGFWTNSVLMFTHLWENANQSIRQLARQPGLSKSRVPRLTQAIARRARAPESW